MSDTPWRDARLLRRGPSLLFGLGYDDERVELATLPRGRVLVIAAAGEVAAALAARGDAVDAIDINPHQVAYARARIAGAPSVAGAAERLLAIGRLLLAAVYPVWRPRRVRRLLELPQEGASLLWRRRFMPAPVRLALRLLLHRHGPIGLLVPARLRAGIPAGLADRLVDAIRRRLGDRDNRFLPRLLLGREHPRWRLPSVPEPGIRWLVGDVLAHLESAPPGGYDGISLSNVADAADPAWTERLRIAATAALAPGGVAILRTIGDGGEAERARAEGDGSGLWGAIRLWRRGGADGA